MKRWEIDIENGRIFTREGLAKNIDLRGYKRISSTFNGKKYDFKQHQIIMIAAGYSPVGLEVNHIDGDKKNNRIQNLEIVTPSENTKHAFRLGLAKTVNKRFTENQVRELRERYAAGELQVDLAKELGCHPEVLGRMVRRTTYKNVI